MVSACNHSTLPVFLHSIISENILSLHPKQWQVFEYTNGQKSLEYINGQKTLKNISSKILVKFKLFYICLIAGDEVGKSYFVKNYLYAN